MPAIPPSSYPVLSDPKPARRTLVGPYIASQPAWMMFRNQKPGQSMADMIAADMESQAKAEGRPSPVIEHPENNKYWVGGGGSGDHDSGDGYVALPEPALILPPVIPAGPVSVSTAPLTTPGVPPMVTPP